MNKQYVLLIGLIAILIAGSLIASPDYTNSDSMNDSSAADNGTSSISNNGFENLLSMFGSNSSSLDNSSDNVEEVDLRLASKSSFLYAKSCCSFLQEGILSIKVWRAEEQQGRRAGGQEGRHFIKLKIESGKWKIVSAF